MHFVVLLPPIYVRAHQVGPRSDAQQHHAVIVVCVETAHRGIFTCGDRVAGDVDGTDCFVDQGLRNRSFEAMCSPQFLLPRVDRWHGTDVVYVKAVVNRTRKEDVILIEKGEGG